MRSLPPLPASLPRRGLSTLAVVLVTLTSACQWITGVPTVKSVDVSVTADSIPVNGTALASGVIHGNGDKIIVNSRVPLTFESTNPSVATVQTTSGQIIGVSVGTTTIIAHARGKSSAPYTLKVYPQRPNRVDVQPPTLYLGGRVQLVITPIGLNGEPLGKRNLTISSGNTGIVSIETDNTTTGTFVRGVTVGGTTVSGTVDGTPFALTVVVLPPQVGKVQAALAKGTNTLVEGESNQLVVQLFAPDNTPISTAGQTISYQSEDLTTATVTSNGIITGIKAGSTNVNVLVAGSTARAQAQITVIQPPVGSVQIINRGQFLRLSSTGTGVPSSRAAVAFDTAGRQLANRPIAYRSTDPSIFTVNTATGLVTPVKLGKASLVASAGAAADTVALTVTPVPIVLLTVTPTQTTIDVGKTQQFAVQLTDSLGTTVTGRQVNWFSTNPQVMTIDQATGLATMAASGTAQAQPQVEVIPGLPGFVNAIQGGAVLVQPTAVASIVVNPSPIQVAPGRTTQYTLTLKDANGNTIFTSRSVSAIAADPAIVSFQTPQGTGTGSVAGLKQGSTTITFQALSSAGTPQGAPATVTVDVVP